VVPSRGGLGCLTLARWAGWSAGRWAATSNIEVSQTSSPVNRGRKGGERRERGQSHKKEKEKGGS